MNAWLNEYSAVRDQPRLWIEYLWLLESREPLSIIRTVALRPGVNVVWAREPETDTGSGLASAGHGVGKTSFCLLLRYCLGDEAQSITTLREKAASSFARGGVAAKVHLDGTTWVVFRPYGAYAHSLAGRGDNLQALFANELDGTFQDFLDELKQAFIDRLPAQTMPGTNQPLEWRHLLAWCIRDQKTRFDAFFHWRDGDGLGFRRARQDPPLFVRSVMGLHDSGLDQLMRDIDDLQGKLKKLDEEEIPELERYPTFALAMVEERLRKSLDVGTDVPIYGDLLSTSLETMIGERSATAQQSDAKFELEMATAEKVLALNLQEQDQLAKAEKILELEQQIAQSLVDDNEEVFKKLSNELKELDRLAGHCRYGDVDFSHCDHIAARRRTSSLPMLFKKQRAEAEVVEQKKRLAQASARVESIKLDVTKQESQVARSRANIRRLQMSHSTSSNEQLAIQRDWEELQQRLRSRSKGTDAPDLITARSRRETLASDLASKQTAYQTYRSQRSERNEAVKNLTRTVSSRLLGEDGYGRFNADSDSRPFELTVGGEAYQVLEVLLGDVAAMLDAATSSSTHHPGLVVHDCPREADMSVRLYREYLLLAMEAELQLGASRCTSFQYIVTTTSPPPTSMQGAPYLALELQPGSDNGLLFRRQLMTQVAGL